MRQPHGQLVNAEPEDKDMPHSSQNQPYWVSRSQCREFKTLDGNLEVDVAVVGAGITGLTTAILLQQLGQRVAVIEMGTVGAATTGHSTGHLDNWFDEMWHVAIQKFGENRARLVAEARTTAIDVIERWDAEFGIAAGFKRIPAYLYAETAATLGLLKKEFQASQTLGLNVEKVDRAPLPFPHQGAVMSPQMARINPLQYVCGLARAFTERGGLLFESTRAESFKEENGGECSVPTNRGAVTAKAIALCGHAALFGMYTVEPRVYPHQSYVIAARVEQEIPDALYWDTASPYHYTRLASSEQPKLLIIGGADHPTGHKMDTREPYRRLEQYIRERYTVQQIETRWSHEYFTTADTLPFIGRVPDHDHIYEATGFSGDGLTFGTAAGILMTDLIMERPNEWAGVFTPTRVKPVAAAGRLSSGMFHMAWHYLGSRFKSGDDIRSLEQLNPGEGGVITIEKEKYAVYRDETGDLHALTPVCQHMGCIVHWNNAEKTWDCPCHGGRYSCYGEVITGPPRKPLSEKPIQQPV